MNLEVFLELRSGGGSRSNGTRFTPAVSQNHLRRDSWLKHMRNKGTDKCVSSCVRHSRRLIYVQIMVRRKRKIGASADHALCIALALPNSTTFFS
jgi:hypothetical protein